MAATQLDPVDAENPCKLCQTPQPDGILCDGCSMWVCVDCINAQNPGALPLALYRYLQKLPSFPWKCHNCSEEPLARQLLNNGTLTAEDMTKFPIPTNPATPTQTNNQPPEPMMSLFREMLNSQNQMLMSLQAAQKQERDVMWAKWSDDRAKEREQRRQERDEIRKERQEEMKIILQAVQTSTTPTETNGTQNRPGHQSSTPPMVAKLPKIQLPSFAGKITDWPNFWESFKINVDDQVSLNPKQKLDYLHQCLKGSALDKVKGLGLLGDKYAEAVRILVSEYGSSRRQEEEGWRALRDITPVNGNLRNLEKFIDDVRAYSSFLGRMGVSKETMDCFVCSNLLHKLPASIQMKIKERKIATGAGEKRWEMVEFLQHLLDLKQLSQITDSKGKNAKVAYANSDEHESVYANEEESNHPSTAAFVQLANGKPNARCAFCNKVNHYSDECKTHPNVTERRELAQKQKLCFNCLGKSHRAQDCKRQKLCYYCKNTGHHCALCFKNTKVNPNQTTSQHLVETEEIETISPHSNEVLLAGPLEEDGIIMATAKVKVTNPENGKIKTLNMYMDSGARYTCIDQKAADTLGLKSSQTVFLDTARFNSNQNEKIKAGIVEIILHGPNGFEMKINAYAIPKMTPPLPIYPTKLSKSTYAKAQKYKPLNTPPGEKQSVSIDILLGMDYYYSITGPTVSSIVPLEGALVVHCTPIGNFLAGNVLLAKQRFPSFHTLCAHTQEDITTLWRMDTIGIKEESVPTADDDVYQRFKETIIFEDGRYQVCWPWRTPNATLPTNFHAAKYRLKQTLSTLKHSAGDEENANLQEYDNIIQDQLTKGVIEPVSDFGPATNLVHYISHFPRIRRDRATTKVRIVYDASAKTKPHGISLNDLMHTGLNYLQNLAGLLIRFRIPKVSIIADIEKAFLQVGLQKADRDAVRFLWIKNLENLDADQNLQVYRFCRTPFGVVASPYLLGATIHYHMEKNPGKIADQVKDNIYMDNIFFAAETTAETIDTYYSAKGLFNAAGMNLREWMTNDLHANSQIPVKDVIPNTSTKVLGLVWDSKNDTLKLPGKPTNAKATSKREILHQVAQMFDPLGFICPLVISGKIVLQKLWKLELDWDDPVPTEIAQEWSEIRDSFNQAYTLQLPRRMISTTDAPIQLMCFTDASQSAYAAVVYSRQTHTNGIDCSLIFAKARVTPLKPTITLPRLELLGILIGTRALRFVETQLRRRVDKKLLWSDSQIALQWVKGGKCTDAYVQRRVSEINKNGDINFFYVRSKDNPADLASRGTGFKKLIESNWFTGPAWASQSETKWPKVNLPGSVAADNYILMAQTALRVEPKETEPKETSIKETGPFEIDPLRYSTLTKLLHVTAFCQKFVEALKNPTKSRTKDLSASDIQKSRILWIKASQRGIETSTWKALKAGKHNQTTRQLDLYLERDIIRCGGRFANAKISEDSKFPILLPNKSAFTKLLIVDMHQKAHHCGPKNTLTLLRQTYWIPQGLSTVRKELTRCIKCRRCEGATFKPPPMANLPTERLCRSPAFFNTGLDYLGPLYIREAGAKDGYQKRWIALFTCFTTRAVHLEVVRNCSADSALNAVQRFVARRGTPKTILTDNATQFIKSKTTLESIWAEAEAEQVMKKLKCYFADKETNWKFIPERSPWVGGFYERLVGLVKRGIKKTLWKATIGEDELTTLVAGIEATLNSRPILSVGPDFDDGNILTPAHFIAPSIPLNFPPSNNDIDDPDYAPSNSRDEMLKNWKKRQRKLDQFWSIWQSQYLQELRESHKREFPKEKGQVQRNPEAGEVVLLKEKTPRTSWKVARISRILPDGEGHVRFVEVKLPSGRTSKRGIRDIVPLEMNPQALAFTTPCHGPGVCQEMN